MGESYHIPRNCVILQLAYGALLYVISGGIRGITELEVLNHIESALGGGFRIQSFFDLILGTRYVVPPSKLH